MSDSQREHDRLVDVAAMPREDESLSPQSLRAFTGQDNVSRDLRIAIGGAKSRGQPMPHTLFFGPPGLGKTTLARIVAAEMGANVHTVMAPTVRKPIDLAMALTSLQNGDVLFIDEIHRLDEAVAELLFPAMTDCRLEIVQQEDMGRGRPVSIPLQPFTLIGATTRAGDLGRPFRQRFDLSVKLNLYEPMAMEPIILRSATLLGMTLADGTVPEVARRSRGTPRISNRFLRRIRDYALSEDAPVVTLELCREAFTWLGIDERGLDEADRRYLDTIAERFRGGPVGLETIAAAMGEDADYLQYEVEPYLLATGLLERTPRGRVLPAGAAEGAAA